MAENQKYCVLQWAGHARYIMERFSGLLARQALVDVTLICEEQKLRVHKLVLASSSVYFEEILQQDLGQEPVIFLKDLGFEILKAMVEFMYCGETTVSHKNISLLLAASKNFKVKELSQIIDTVMETDNFSMKMCKVPDGLKMINNTSKESEIQSNHDRSLKDSSAIFCDNSSNDTYMSESQSLEINISNNNLDNGHEHTLYEDSYDIDPRKNCGNTIALVNKLNITERKEGYVAARCNVKDITQYESVTKANNAFTDVQKLQPLYEKCCDFSGIDKCASLSQSYLLANDKDSAQCSFDNLVPNKVGRYVKVYTHKRRKSIDEVRNNLIEINKLIPKPPSTDCIDLLDEPSSNDVPVTLLTSLDMESAEYILSLSNENMHSMKKYQADEQGSSTIYNADVDVCDNSKAYDDYRTSKRKQPTDNNNIEMEKPVLRRSIRLNQQENDELTNGNTSVGETFIDRHNKKRNLPNKMEPFPKGKKCKFKKFDRMVPNQNIKRMQSNKKSYNHFRSQRNSSKFIMKKNKKKQEEQKEEEEYLKTNKCEIFGNIEVKNLKISTTTGASNLHTIEYIDRALWGDMSDIIERDECITNLSDYTPNGEIPFAVGLLPLRTALEKMQATPDYQPRKTRSSVAPIKQEINNFKRKNYIPPEKYAIGKQQNSNNNEQNNNNNNNTNTVYHIEIRTAPTQYVKSRKKFLPEHITTLRSTTIVNRQ